MSGLLTTRQAGELLGYSGEKIRQMCEQGAFAGATRDGYGGHWRIPEDDVESFKESARPKVRRRGLANNPNSAK